MATYFLLFFLLATQAIFYAKTTSVLDIKFNKIKVLSHRACSAQTIAKHEADEPLHVILNLSALTLSHLRRVMIPYEKHHPYEEKLSVLYFNIFKTVDMKSNFNATG